MQLGPTADKLYKEFEPHRKHITFPLLRLLEDESATHILCDCEAIAHSRFRHLGQFFMEPSDFYDAPTNKVLHLIQSVGLIKG
jgi:hypothetical protein